MSDRLQVIVSHSVVSNSFATLWIVTHQASQSMVRRLDGLLLPSPGDLSNIGIEPKSPAWQGDSLPQNYQGS